MVEMATQAVGYAPSLTLMLLIDSHGGKQKGDRSFASFLSLVVARAKTTIGNKNDKKGIFTRVRANFHWCWRRLRLSRYIYYGMGSEKSEKRTATLRFESRRTRFVRKKRQVIGKP